MTFSSEHPELLNNPTLGAATTNPYLDQVEAQSTEDYNARLENREPRTVIAEDRYPQFMPSGSVPSSVQPKLSFEGDIPPVAEGTEEVQSLIDSANEDALFSTEDFTDGD